MNWLCQKTEKGPAIACAMNDDFKLKNVPNQMYGGKKLNDVICVTHEIKEKNAQFQKSFVKNVASLMDAEYPCYPQLYFPWRRPL